MSLERDLKEAFERHASDASPAPGAWEHVEARVVRSHRVRASLASAVAVAAIVAAAITIPRLARNESGPFVSPGKSTSPVESTFPPPDSAPFANDTLGYATSVPLDWKHSSFEGHDEFYPKNLQSLEPGAPTFAVDISLEFAAYGTQVSHTTGRTTIAGRNTLIEETQDANGHQVHYAIDWSQFTGCGGPPTCSSNFSGGPKTLNVRLIGSTVTLWDQYSAQGEKLARSIGEVAEASRATPSPAAETFRSMMTKFLEARLHGSGAEGFLSAEAKRQFDAGDANLYATGIPARPWIRYDITDERAADANSYEFSVNMYDSYDTSGPETSFSYTTETIGIGPGTTWEGRETGFVIRFVTVVSSTQT